MYALVLKSQENHPNYWMFYQLSFDLEVILKLTCYSSAILQLSKNKYKAVRLDDNIVIKSCYDGADAEFAIYKLDIPVDLSNQFQFA